MGVACCSWVEMEVEAEGDEEAKKVEVLLIPTSAQHFAMVLSHNASHYRYDEVVEGVDRDP
jgi:hypothetical protein